MDGPGPQQHLPGGKPAVVPVPPLAQSIDVLFGGEHWGKNDRIYSNEEIIKVKTEDISIEEHTKSKMRAHKKQHTHRAQQQKYNKRTPNPPATLYASGDFPMQHKSSSGHIVQPKAPHCCVVEVRLSVTHQDGDVDPGHCVME